MRARNTKFTILTREEVIAQGIQIRKREVEVPQKNGDIYVYERECYYDSRVRYERSLGQKLIGKKIQGNDEINNTRPKRKNGALQKETANQRVKRIESSESDDISAVKLHVGMIDILDHLAKESGIDKDIEDSTDIPTALKILSIARFMVADDSPSLAKIEEFQYTHLLPYEDGINKDVYHRLFDEIGDDEELKQGFFLRRVAREKDKTVYIAYDSTTESTDSKWLKSARYGMNKADDGRKTLKYALMYSMNSSMPICYYTQQGNIPDVMTVKRLEEQVAALGINDFVIVADNGYCSDPNIDYALLHGHDILTRIETNVSWVNDLLMENYSKLTSTASALAPDRSMHGISIPFERNAKIIQDGNNELCGTFKCFLLLYSSEELKSEENIALDKKLHIMKQEIENGKKVSTYCRSDRQMINSCLKIHDEKKSITVTFRQRGINNYRKEHGIFALFSSRESDPEKGLALYRKRGEIESAFRVHKEDLKGNMPDCSLDTVFEGKTFVQFVSLILQEALITRVNEMKRTLGLPNGDDEHDLKTILDAEKKLKAWLEDRSIKRILNWFDTNDRIIVSNKMKIKRWNSEVIARDKLFLQKLGIEIKN